MYKGEITGTITLLKGKDRNHFLKYQRWRVDEKNSRGKKYRQ
jgi:hypothetical protein